MISPLSFYRLLLLLLRPVFSVQVTISLSLWADWMAIPDESSSSMPEVGVLEIIVCHDILPGVCCRQPFTRAGQGYAYEVEIQNLFAGDVGVVWSDRVPFEGSSPGCSGRALETVIGPSRSWSVISSPSPHEYTGASYISTPKNLPPSDTESEWLNAEGMKALVWGGGKWFAKGVDPSQLTQWFPKTSKRGITSKDKGQLYASPPNLFKYPHVMVINGTNYTDDSRGDLVYRSDAGTVLDLNALHD